MGARKFRKKPVEIEAMQFHGQVESGSEIAAWCGGYYDDAGDGRGGWVEIRTLEGTMQATPGDWVIKGVQGEFYPCKPGVFAATYEAVAVIASMPLRITRDQVHAALDVLGIPRADVRSVVLDQAGTVTVRELMKPETRAELGEGYVHVERVTVIPDGHRG